MALITASLPLIAVVTPATSASGAKSHFWIFALYDVCGGKLRLGKGSKAGIVTARLHPCRCLHVSRLVTDKARLGRQRNTLINEFNSNTQRHR